MSGRKPGRKGVVNINDLYFNYVRSILTGHNISLIGDFVAGEMTLSVEKNNFFKGHIYFDLDLV